MNPEIKSAVIGMLTADTTLKNLLGGAFIFQNRRPSKRRQRMISIWSPHIGVGQYIQKREILFQIDVWAESQQQADLISEQVFVLLHDKVPTGVAGYKQFTMLLSGHNEIPEDEETELFHNADEYTMQALKTA